MPGELTRAGEGVFDGLIEAADVADLSIYRNTFSAQRFEASASEMRRRGRSEFLAVAFRLSGQSLTRQHDRTLIQKAGDLTLLDGAAPFDLQFSGPSSALLIEVPRERIERLLGPARVFAALDVSGDLPGAAVSRAFFQSLTQVEGQLSPETAQRLSSVGIDLLVASFAERMAMETPKPLQGTVTLQRARAHVEANLGDPTLDPPNLAAAVGVSLRRLQELFAEHGRHVSEWIWQRRLETAAERLADPGQMHVPIGTLAYGCGFTSQTHFSHRFRSRYDMSPSEYRRCAAAARLKQP